MKKSSQIKIFTHAKDSFYPEEGLRAQRHRRCPMRGFLICAILLVSNTAHASNIVSIAKSEIGHGEEGSDNSGRYVELYTHGRQVAWCAAFVSYVLEKSANNRLPYLLSAKEFFKYAEKHSMITNNPKPGDLIVFYRGSRNGNLGHIGIISRVSKDEIVSIEGNVGKYPAKVKEVHHSRESLKNLLGFIKTN